MSYTQENISSDNDSQIDVQQPYKYYPIHYVNTTPVKNPHREFYEEKIARKRYTEHIIKTNNYSKAQKKFRNFQRQLHQIKSISVKETNGPIWFQNLSDKQISILEELDVHLKEDMDMATSKNTKQALKALGVQSFIPNTVAMDALISSKLYPVPYLTSIKDYLIKKDELKNKHTCNTNKVLSPEKRILMSSILYLAFPRLIKKLDFCLEEPVPDKKLKYKILPQSKQKSKSYVSPYLEESPEPGLPWTKLEEIKWHNKKVKKQRANKQLKAEKQQALNELAMDIRNRTTLKTQVDYPKHPFDEMFYNPARMEMFKNKNLKEPMEKCTVIHSDAVNDLSETSLIARQNVLSEALEKIQPTIADEILSSEFSTSTRIVADVETVDSSGTLFPLTSGRSSRQSSMIVEEDVIENCSKDQTDNIPENAYGWQYMNTFTDSSFNSSQETLASGNEHDDAYHNISDGMEECEDGTDDGKDDDKDNEKDSVKDGDNNQQNNSLKCGRDMDSVLMSGINETEAIVLKLFQALPNDDELSPCPTPMHSSATYETLSADDDDEESKSDSMIDQTFTSMSMSTDLNESVYAVDKKLSIYNMLKKNEGTPIMSVEQSAPEIREELISTEQCHQAITEDNTINLEVFLAAFRTLPPWKQLKAVLEFLSILGDPIAGFPDLIDLQQLKRWFSLRLNIDRRMTPKIKRNLMKKSMDAWNMTRKKFTSIPVPHNPFSVHQKEKLITWDEIDITKKQIKLLKEEFATGIKHLSINNAREFYTSTQNEYFHTPLNKNFKKVFYDYFPARENDLILFNSEKTSSKSKKKL